MSAENLQIISIVAFALSAILFLVAIFLFFRLDVRSIWNELSGKTAKKKIQELRAKNRRGQGNKTIFPIIEGFENNTEKIKRDKINLLHEETDTVCLDTEKGTMVLSVDEETTVLGGTIVLDGDEGTTVLNKMKKVLRVDRVIVHTVERI